MFSRIRLLGLPVWFVVFMMALPGCSSGGDIPTPAPQTGALQGVMRPPSAATLATATSNQGQAYTTVPNRNTGAYTISNVPLGFYTVRFTAAPGFVALSSAMPLVQTSQTATAGTTFMTYTNAASGIHGLVT